jgi:tetratricopeptide (TPR) repeat protein
MAVAAEDVPTARREHANLVDFGRRGRAAETVKAYHVNILLLEEKYQEALNELRALNLDKLAKKSAPMVQSQIAYCHMQLGDPEKGLQIAQSALTGMENMGPDYALSGHAVVGIGHFLLGRSSEAVPHLERAYAGSAHLPGIRASSAFYLGESLSALGRREEAKEAYQRAQGALPNSRDGMRATERLRATS